MVCNRQAGDTLVEVLSALAVLGLAIVGTITIMTRGLVAAQTALEHSQVRLLVSGQGEMLERLRDEYVRDPASSSGQLWHAIIAASNTNQPTYGDDCAIPANKAGTAFYLDQQATQIVKTAYSTPAIPTGLPTPGSGFWVEPSKSAGVVQPYVDFVIRACWQGIGGINQRTVTAMRLYDPDPTH